MSSVGGGRAAAVAVAAVGKAARRFHRGEEIKNASKYSTRQRVKLKGVHWDHKDKGGGGHCVSESGYSLFF
jgi:hypothetical protein